MTKTIIAPAIHPGEFLRDELEERNLTQKRFAEMIGKTPTEVGYIIRGERGVNADFAIRLSIVLGSSANLRLGLQNKRDLYVLQKQESKKPIFAEIRKNVAALQKETVFA